MSKFKNILTFTDALALLLAAWLILAGVNMFLDDTKLTLFDGRSRMFGVFGLVFAGMLIGAYINRASHTKHLNEVVENNKSKGGKK